MHHPQIRTIMIRLKSNPLKRIKCKKTLTFRPPFLIRTMVVPPKKHSSPPLLKPKPTHPTRIPTPFTLPPTIIPTPIPNAPKVTMRKKPMKEGSSVQEIEFVPISQTLEGVRPKHTKKRPDTPRLNRPTHPTPPTK